jgi:hypothetical protein
MKGADNPSQALPRHEPQEAVSRDLAAMEDACARDCLLIRDVTPQSPGLYSACHLLSLSCSR